jgi:hypothetical protein
MFSMMEKAVVIGDPMDRFYDVSAGRTHIFCTFCYNLYFTFEHGKRGSMIFANFSVFLRSFAISDT